jgi:hypothetical protein
MECWEHMNCSTKVMQDCSAYPDKGRICWKVTGTLCDGGKLEMANLGEKILHCKKCDYYVSYADKF